MGIKKVIRKQIEKRQGLIKYQDFWEKVYRYSLIGMNIGGGSDTSNSGEEYVVKCLRERFVKDDSESVIFDVGANVGDYALLLRKYFEKIQIHCFEPAKDTYSLLCKNIREEKNIKTNKFGLSDISEESTLYYDEDTSGMASLYKRQLDWRNIEFSKSEQIQLKKLDEYCEQEGIHSIEFLKIDVEGNEYKVLQGAQRMLANNAINIIQIEFGGCNIDSRIFFRDFGIFYTKNISFIE